MVNSIEILDDGSIVVEVLEQGPPGLPGNAGGSYTHTQSVAADVWQISHNLGYKPNWEVRNDSGAVIEARIVHQNNNNTFVYVNPAMTGSARGL